MIGMPYKILPTNEFEKDFKKIDSFMQERIKKKVEEVAENPERYKHLHDGLAGKIGFLLIFQIVADYRITAKQAICPKD